MEIGLVGLGKMGANMATRLLQGGHKVVAFDLNADAVRVIEKEGAEGASSLADVAKRLEAPRAVWVMVPAGDPTEKTIQALAQQMKPGDVILEGGNSNYKDSMRRAEELRKQKLRFVDVGTSGGIWGLKEGYSLMIGGEPDVVKRLSPIFQTLAPDKEKGWGHVGPNGAGHFVKMVHNGIEYGLMQAYAEGFELMGKKKEFTLDLAQIAEIWRDGSVVRSWLLDLTAAALQANPKLEGIAPHVSDSGEGRWTIQEAVDLGVATPVIADALMVRFASQEPDAFAFKLLAAMRNQFGGHAVKKGT